MEQKKSTLVVLHGWRHDSTLWEAFRSRFHNRDVLLIDLPGFGKEPLVSALWGVPEYAEWVRKRIESEKWENVVLLGHSFGGRIAATLASERPSWLSRLILYSAPVLYRPRMSVTLKGVLAKLLKPFLPRAVRTQLTETPDRADARAHGLEEVFRRVISYDLTDKLPLISVPTLLVWGTNDTYPPLHIAEEAHKLISGSTLTRIEGAGHNAHLEKPELFYGCVAKFLT